MKNSVGNKIGSGKFCDTAASGSGGRSCQCQCTTGLRVDKRIAKSKKAGQQCQLLSETNQYTNIKSTNSDQEDEITDKLVLDNNEIIENSEILEFIVNSKISSNIENNIQIQQDEEEPVVKDYFDEKFVWKKQKIISMSREIEPPKCLFLPHRRLSLQHTNKISSALGNSITSYYSSM